MFRLRTTTTKSTAVPPTPSPRKFPDEGAILFAILAQFLATACLTLNVNVALPEAAVQRATDDYVRDLYRAKEKGKTSSTGSDSAAPTVSSPAVSPSPTKSRLDSLFVPSAYAEDETRMKLDSSKARRIFARLKSRVGEVIAAKQAGTLGEANNGKLVLRSPEKLKSSDKARLTSLMSDENSDRSDLYEEALSANHLEKSKLQDIEKSFTRSFQTESPSGTWIQDMDGNWLKKP